ncbi:response regulator transcription factor [Pseudovibrio flavus]|uniref:response regulator transcription factor n=1 Tax=Pseudovibrio flavus TaxID=2529854 RepID=UPI00211CC08F|nr:helix-turn-helix transcriptional regulator [Pseudovibrio flavus]
MVRSLDDGLFCAFMLAKTGRSGEARTLMSMLGGRHATQLSVCMKKTAEFILVDIHVKAYESKAFDQTDKQLILNALRSIDADDCIGQALANNHLSTIEFHLGNFDRAQEYAETAAALYLQAGAVFGANHLHSHIGQVRLYRGDLLGAAGQFTKMVSSTHPNAPDGNSLEDAYRILSAEVCYEADQLQEAEQLLAPLIGRHKEIDAWGTLHGAYFRVRTRLALERGGLAEALGILAEGESYAQTRQMKLLKRQMQLERAEAYIRFNELPQARRELSQLKAHPDLKLWRNNDDWGLHSTLIVTAVARWLVRNRQGADALDLITLCEDEAIRRGRLLCLAKMRIVKAEAHWQVDQKTLATNSLLSSLRLLTGQPFRRFLVEDGMYAKPIVQAILDGNYISFPPERAIKTALQDIMYGWVVRKPRAQNTADQSHAAGLEKYTYEYLKLMAAGMSNKEIAMLKGVSENTAKYHLKKIFKQLNVSSRSKAVAVARELKIID